MAPASADALFAVVMSTSEAGAATNAAISCETPRRSGFARARGTVCAMRDPRSLTVAIRLRPLCHERVIARCRVRGAATLPCRPLDADVFGRAELQRRGR